jgi:hypothetical protein
MQTVCVCACALAFVCVCVRLPCQFCFSSFSQFCEKRLNLPHVYPFVRMEQLGSHWTDFHEIMYLNIFRKSIEKIQVSFKSNKSNGYFT